MSIVCCKVYDDRIEMASDSIGVRGWTQNRGENIIYSKLTKINDILVGSVGTMEEGVLLQIYLKTRKPKDATEDSIIEFLSEFSSWKKKRTDNPGFDGSHMLSFGGKAFTIHNYCVGEIKTYDSIGAGMDYALSALYLGTDVKKAVETACELSVYCEKPIVHYVINKENKNG